VHRTIARVISPYTQTGTVDSTFYSTPTGAAGRDADG